MPKIITTEQIKAARILLGWDQVALAAAAQVGIATVRRIESVPGPIDLKSRSAQKITRALEQVGGVMFLQETVAHGPGLRLGKH